MAQKAIGPTFAAELAAAGIEGLPFTWSADGTLNTGALDAAGRDAVRAVYAAHDPTKAVPRFATQWQLLRALTDAQRAAYPGAKGWDQRMFTARDTPWPEDNPKIGRIADVLGTTPRAWFDAALAS